MSRRRYARDGDVHRLVGLAARLLVVEAAAAPFNLDPRARLVLDVLDKETAGADYLGPDVEVADRLKLDRELDFGPLAALAPLAETVVDRSTGNASSSRPGGVGAGPGRTLAEALTVASPLRAIFDERAEVLVDQYLDLVFREQDEVRMTSQGR